MSQFGGSPRDQEYGFFTTPARTPSTSQFGATAVDSRPTSAGAASPSGDAGERPSPAFGLPAPTHRAEPERSGNRLALPLVLVLVVALLGGAAAAYQGGLIPGLNQSGSDEPAVVTPPLAPYVVAAPDQLLGWERSSGAEARQIEAMFDGSGALPADAMTSFLYVTGRGKAALYGAVIVQHLSKAEQRVYLTAATRGMRKTSPGDTLGAFTDRPAGALGGILRCATLQTKPASTTCVFTSSETSGVVVRVGQTGKQAVDDARTARETLITRR